MRNHEFPGTWISRIRHDPKAVIILTNVNLRTFAARSACARTPWGGCNPSIFFYNNRTDWAQRVTSPIVHDVTNLFTFTTTRSNVLAPTNQPNRKWPGSYHNNSKNILFLFLFQQEYLWAVKVNVPSGSIFLPKFEESELDDTSVHSSDIVW